MQLTQTNTVFSRIAPVSSFCAEKSTFEENSDFNCNRHNSPEDLRSQKGGRSGCTRPPRHSRARPGWARALVWRGRLSRPPTLSFGLLKALDLIIIGGFVIFRETHPRSAANAISILGIRSSVLEPCRDGDSEEIITIVIITASPSTIHDSPIHV